MKAVLVGEARGRYEEEYDHGLVGPSGWETARILAEAKIAEPLPNPYPSPQDMIAFWEDLRDREIISITNVFEEHPPQNNNGIFFDREQGSRNYPPIKIKNSVKYVLPEYIHHIERLRKELTSIKPNLVVALGNIASWATLGQTSITKIRGTVQTGLEYLGDQKILPTLHPAFILHEGGWNNRPILVADLIKASREMEFPEIRRPERWITVAESLSEIREWFSRPAKKYSIDIESGYALFSRAELNDMQKTPRGRKMKHLLSEMISMVSFARTPSDMLVVQFVKRAPEGVFEKGAMNFWSKVEDEIEAWLLVILQGLRRNIPKVFQNGMYDIGRFLSMGILPTLCFDDTMLLHHSKWPEMKKDLGFLASLYCDEVAWKLIYGNRETLKRDE